MAAASESGSKIDEKYLEMLQNKLENWSQKRQLELKQELNQRKTAQIYFEDVEESLNKAKADSLLLKEQGKKPKMVEVLAELAKAKAGILVLKKENNARLKEVEAQIAAAVGTEMDVDGGEENGSAQETDLFKEFVKVTCISDSAQFDDSSSTRSFSIGDEDESSCEEGSENGDVDLEVEEDELKGLKDDLDGSVLAHFVEENHPLLKLFD